MTSHPVPLPQSFCKFPTSLGQALTHRAPSSMSLKDRVAEAERILDKSKFDRMLADARLNRQTAGFQDGWDAAISFCRTALEGGESHESLFKGFKLRTAAPVAKTPKPRHFIGNEFDNRAMTPDEIEKTWPSQGRANAIPAPISCKILKFVAPPSKFARILAWLRGGASC